MANGERTDPLVSFRFRVEVDNLIQAGFAECSGLQVETELEEVREGGKTPSNTSSPRGASMSTSL
jgi:phage tail-like protein